MSARAARAAFGDRGDRRGDGDPGIHRRPRLKAAGTIQRLIAIAIDAAFGVLVVAVCLATGLLDATPLDIPAGWFWTEWWLKSWLDDPALFVQPIVWMLTADVLWTMSWELAYGRTPGAILTRIEVVDSDGDPPHPVRSLVRTVGIVVGIFTLGLGLLWSVVAPSRRALHDLLSGTWVVKSE